jgi:hypothetical protein
MNGKQEHDDSIDKQLVEVRGGILQQTLRLRYWLFSLFSIVLLSIIGRQVQLYIVARLNPFWIAGVIFVLLFVLLARICKERRDRQAPLLVVGCSLFLVISGIVAVYMGYLLPIEAVHFLVFSCFGWISATVFGPFYGVVVVLSTSVGDEIVQHFLPNRVGDLHDVTVNFISGCAGVILWRK